MAERNPALYNELATALAKAQTDFPDIPKDKTVTVKMKTGGTYSFKYADLATVIKAVRPALTKNGLSVSQLIQDSSLETILLHSSGQTLSTTVTFQRPGDIKEYGGVTTYLRRYCYCAIIGVSTEEDTDGPQPGSNRSTDNQNTKRPEPVKKFNPKSEYERAIDPRTNGASQTVAGPSDDSRTQPNAVESSPHPDNEEPRKPNTISDKQRTRLFTIATSKDWKEEELKTIIKSSFGITSSKDILTKDYENLCDALEHCNDIDHAVDQIMIRKGK